MVNKIDLRPAHIEDIEFMFNLFKFSRSDFEGFAGMDETIVSNVIYGQFKLEQDYIKNEFPSAMENIILFEGIPMGRLCTYSNNSFIRILNISILPEYRRKGIGRKLISDILKEASETNKYVCLSVMWFNNGARSLYERLGFYVVNDESVRCEMHCFPDILEENG